MLKAGEQLILQKILYKLKIDENALRRRNVNTRPTAYMQRILEMDRISKGEEMISKPKDKKAEENIFQLEFEPEKKDSNAVKKQPMDAIVPGVLSNAKKYPYKPLKFATDYVTTGFNNNVLGTRYQAYQGGAGPINLTSDNGLNGMVRIGIADIMEDIKISGGFRISSNLKDNDWLFQFTNLRKRLDWGLSYFRSVKQLGFENDNANYPGKLISNLYQATISYPFDVTKSIRITAGVRKDNAIESSFDVISLSNKPVSKTYGLMRAELVYDNTLNPVENILTVFQY